MQNYLLSALPCLLMTLLWVIPLNFFISANYDFRNSGALWFAIGSFGFILTAFLLNKPI